MLMMSTLDSLVQLGWAARDRTGEISASIGVGACGDAKEQTPVPITLVFQMHDWASHVLREWHEGQGNALASREGLRQRKSDICESP